nr:hypothetical protein Iba_scaffold14766CG0020 [Ipomoea batatas]
MEGFVTAMNFASAVCARKRAGSIAATRTSVGRTMMLCPMPIGNTPTCLQRQLLVLIHATNAKKERAGAKYTEDVGVPWCAKAVKPACASDVKCVASEIAIATPVMISIKMLRFD